MKRNLLRSRDGNVEERVGSIELFFDLVFVFAVTQISHAIILHPDPLGFLEAGLLFLAIWWVWVDTAWVTNWLDVRHGPVRALLFALMGVALMMSISLPQAFGSRALAFALSYLGIQLGRHAFMLAALRLHSRDNYLNFLRIVSWSLVEAPFWIAGALSETLPAQLALWAIALVIVTAGPIAAFWVSRAIIFPNAAGSSSSSRSANRSWSPAAPSAKCAGTRPRSPPSPAPSSARSRCGGSISISAPSGRRGS
jgi:low temperature requirement protein LtrA